MLEGRKFSHHLLWFKRKEKHTRCDGRTFWTPNKHNPQQDRNITASQIITKTAYICDGLFIPKWGFFCHQSGAATTRATHRLHGCVAETRGKGDHCGSMSPVVTSIHPRTSCFQSVESYLFLLNITNSACRCWKEPRNTSTWPLPQQESIF